MDGKRKAPGTRRRRRREIWREEIGDYLSEVIEWCLASRPGTAWPILPEPICDYADF